MSTTPGPTVARPPASVVWWPVRALVGLVAVGAFGSVAFVAFLATGWSEPGSEVPQYAVMSICGAVAGAVTAWALLGERAAAVLVGAAVGLLPTVFAVASRFTDLV